MSQEAEAGTSGPAVQDMPAMPSLPTPPPRPPAPPKPMAMHADLFAQPAPSQLSPVRKAKSGGVGRVIKRLIALVVVVGVLGALALFISGFLSGLNKDFPTYPDAIPPYDSVTVEMRGVGFDGSPVGFTVSSNGARTLLEMTVDVGDIGVDVAAVITDGKTAFGQSTDGTWSYTAFDNSTNVFGGMAAMSQLSTWSNTVPPELRDHVDVVSSEETEVDGHAVTEHELIIAAQEFQKDDPTAYSLWAARVGATDPAPAGLVRLILWVDDAGVVWKMSSYGDGEEAKAETITLVEYSTDTFVPNYPTEYVDLINDPAAAAASS